MTRNYPCEGDRGKHSRQKDCKKVWQECILSTPFFSSLLVLSSFSLSLHGDKMVTTALNIASTFKSGKRERGSISLVCPFHKKSKSFPEASEQTSLIVHWEKCSSSGQSLTKRGDKKTGLNQENSFFDTKVKNEISEQQCCCLGLFCRQSKCVSQRLQQ